MIKNAPSMLLMAYLMAAGDVSADTITADVAALGFVGNPGIASPGSVDWIFFAPEGSAVLNFQVAGYRTLDGKGSHTDIFHLSVDGSEIFSGTFVLGGSGVNLVFSNLNHAVYSIHDVVFRSGGLIDFTVPIILQSGLDYGTGNQDITFSYSGVAQGLLDEGWGVNFASVTVTSSSAVVPSVPLPGAWTLMMLGLLSGCLHNLNKDAKKSVGTGFCV